MQTNVELSREVPNGRNKFGWLVGVYGVKSVRTMLVLALLESSGSSQKLQGLRTILTAHRGASAPQPTIKKWPKLSMSYECNIAIL